MHSLYMYVRMYVCVCTYVCMYVCTYGCTIERIRFGVGGVHMYVGTGGCVRWVCVYVVAAWVENGHYVCISQEVVCKVGSSPLLLRSIVYMDIRTYDTHVCKQEYSGSVNIFPLSSAPCPVYLVCEGCPSWTWLGLSAPARLRGMARW